MSYFRNIFTILAASLLISACRGEQVIEEEVIVENFQTVYVSSEAYGGGAGSYYKGIYLKSGRAHNILAEFRTNHRIRLRYDRERSVLRISTCRATVIFSGKKSETSLDNGQKLKLVFVERDAC